jgi:hypothetical protein
MMLINDLKYDENNDIRFDGEDKADLYSYWRAANGTVSWTSAMERTLDASDLSLSIIITTLVVAA